MSATSIVETVDVPPAKWLIDGATTRRQAIQRAGLLLAGGGLAGLLAACDTSAPAASSSSSGGLLGRGIAGGKMYFITFLSTLNYFDGVKQGFMDAIAAFGGGKFTTLGPTAADGPAEVTTIEQVLSQKVPMAITPFEDKLLTPVINKALDMGIPTLTLDGEAPSANAIHVGTGNLNAGVTCGKRMIKDLGGSGKILLTRQETQNFSFILREQGFKQAVADTNGAVQIVATINDHDDAVQAATAVGQALQAHPEVTGIFTISAGAGLGTVKAVSSANNSNIKALGVFSNDPAVFKTLTGPTPLTFIAAQETYKEGFYAAVMLQLAAANALTPKPPNSFDKIKAGDPFMLPVNTDTGLSIVDKNNVQAFLG